MQLQTIDESGVDVVAPGNGRPRDLRSLNLPVGVQEFLHLQIQKKKKILLQCVIPIAAESVNGSALLLLALQLLPLHDGRPVCFVFLLKR